MQQDECFVELRPGFQASGPGTDESASCSGRTDISTGAPTPIPAGADRLRLAPASSATVAVPLRTAATLPFMRLVVPMKPLTKSVCGRS